MPRYASDTTVPVERSKAEIEGMVSRYGASRFTSGWIADESAFVGFVLKQLFIRFVLPVPKRTEKRFTHREKRGVYVKLTDIQNETAWQQEIRSRWRCLSLVVKAKLEAVECGISTLENEFMAFIVVPGSDVTIGEVVGKMLPEIRAGKTPLALTGKSDIQDAEIVN